MTRFPALESVQPRADGLNGRPALKAVGAVGRQQEAAVSARGPAQKTPEGHAGFQSGLLAGELAAPPVRRTGGLPTVRGSLLAGHA